MIEWPDGANVLAKLQASDAGTTVPVRYEGAVEKLTAPMDRACSYILQADLEDQAEKTGGKISVQQDGLWPAMDEVKA